MKKKLIAFVGALMLSALVPILLKWSHEASLWDAATAIFTATNLITILAVWYMFGRTILENAKRSVSELKKKLIPSLLVFVAATFLIAFFLFGLGNYLLYLIKGWDTTGFLNILWKREFTGAFISVTIGVIISAIFYFYINWRQAIGREQQLREENLKYRYKNLKTQVNPHFLFNSLNTLSELIYVNTKRADSYIRKLSEVYRYILDKEETDLIPLTEELSFVQQYYDLQRERVEEKVLLEIVFDQPNQFQIIPVSLQLLVENAFKHNIMSQQEPLWIRIYREGDNILVANHIQKKNIIKTSSGTGLTNLGERVKLILGKEMQVIHKNHLFIVKLPLVRNNI